MASLNIGTVLLLPAPGSGCPELFVAELFVAELFVAELSTPDEGHFGRHHRHELHIRIQRHFGHMKHRICDMRDIHGGFRAT